MIKYCLILIYDIDIDMASLSTGSLTLIGDFGLILDIIGNNTRRKILATLAREPMYFNQLAKEIDIGQQAILRHVNALEDVGLIKSYAEKSNLGAPDRKCYQLNSSFSLTVSISQDSFSIENHKIEQYRYKESDNFYMEYDLLSQGDDGESLQRLQANLVNIEKEITNLDSRLNDLRALKQLIVHRLHKIARDNFEEEFERKILHTIMDEAPKSISELANKLNEKPSHIRNILNKVNNMNNWEIEPYDWLRNRLFGDMDPFSRDWFNDIPKQFEQMRRGMERMFQEQFRDIDETKIPKELIKEYQTSEGAKVREVGPLVYGYSMTVGPDGRPKVREFGNAKSLLGQRGISAGTTGAATIGKPLTAGEIEPLSDITTTDKDIKVVVEMPGIDKKDIKISAYDSSVEISTANTSERKYRSVIELPPEANTETVKSTYHNGILEITFKKKEQTKPKAKEIKVE